MPGPTRRDPARPRRRPHPFAGSAVPATIEQLMEYLQHFDAETPIYLTLGDACLEGAEDYLALDRALDDLARQSDER